MDYYEDIQVTFEDEVTGADIDITFDMKVDTDFDDYTHNITVTNVRGNEEEIIEQDTLLECALEVLREEEDEFEL